MNAPLLKTVKVLDTEQYEADFPPDNLVALNEWLQGYLASIPPEYRKDAKVHLGYREDHGDSIWVTVRIFYTRPETPEEIAERVNRRAEAVAEKERQEKLLYSQLKVKYESPEEPNVT